MKLRLGKGDKWNAWDGEVYVNTLNQYIEATEAGFYAVTNMEMKLADSWFESKISLLRKLLAARVPDRSFLGNHISVNDIRYLPARLLFISEDITDDEAFAGERATLGIRTVRDLVERGKL